MVSVKQSVCVCAVVCVVFASVQRRRLSSVKSSKLVQCWVDDGRCAKRLLKGAWCIVTLCVVVEGYGGAAEHSPPGLIIV